MSDSEPGLEEEMKGLDDNATVSPETPNTFGRGLIRHLGWLRPPALLLIK